MEHKGLEALYNVRYNDYDNQKRHSELCDIIEQELKDYEQLKEMYNHALEVHSKLSENIVEYKKKDKALEIIKNKNVNVAYLKQAFLWNDDNKRGCEDYNCHFGCDDDGYHSNELTQEEYDLLKEVLL